MCKLERDRRENSEQYLAQVKENKYEQMLMSIGKNSHYFYATKRFVSDMMR